MNSLSKDVIEGILQHLAPKDVVRMRTLNKSLKLIIDETTCGKFLKQASENRIPSRNDLHIFAITQAEICVLEWLRNTQGILGR